MSTIISTPEVILQSCSERNRYRMIFYKGRFVSVANFCSVRRSAQRGHRKMFSRLPEIVG